MVLHAFNLRPSYHRTRRHGGDTDIQELPPMADTLKSGGGDPSSGLCVCVRRYRALGYWESCIDHRWSDSFRFWSASHSVLFIAMFTRLFCDVR